MSQNNSSKELHIRISYNPRVVTSIFLGTLLGVMLTFSVHAISAWTAPTQAPPGGNVAAPVNVSSLTQTKVGRLNVTQLGDANDGTYYLDPNGTSVLNAIHPNIIYDHQDVSYRLDPNGTSLLNDLRANILYDKWDVNYYMQPRGWTKLNALQIVGDTVAPWPDDGNDVVTVDYLNSIVGGGAGPNCTQVTKTCVAAGGSDSTCTATASCPAGYIAVGLSCNGDYESIGATSANCSGLSGAKVTVGCCM